MCRPRSFLEMRCPANLRPVNHTTRKGVETHDKTHLFEICSVYKEDWGCQRAVSLYFLPHFVQIITMNTTTDYANSNPPVLPKASEPVALASATGKPSPQCTASAEDPNIIAQPILLTAASGVFPPRRLTTSTCSSPPLEPAPEGQSPGSSSSSDSCGSPTSLYLHIPCEDTNEKASWFNGPLSPPQSSGGSLLLGHRDSRAFLNST